MKKIIILIFILFFLISLMMSVKNIFKWKLDSYKTERQIKEIQDIVEIKEIKNRKEIEIIEQKTDNIKTNHYHDYTKMILINVYFNKLKKINSNTKGWIQVKGTNINYPFV